MAKKPQGPLQGLNIELSRISTSLVLLERVITDKAALELIGEVKRAHERAFDHMCTISATLSTL